ncbi:hypothetical protein TNCV_4088661 [Trichonephila clavipes]|nr:hypothetical protein TNCV_4088661 [Trichonephila clavipes]
MATGSYLTPIYSRSQNEIQGDLHKFLTGYIAANTFAQLCLFVAGDDLLFGMTTHIHAFCQFDHVRSHSVA